MVVKVLAPRTAVTTKRSRLTRLSALRFLLESLNVTRTFLVDGAVNAVLATFMKRLVEPIVTFLVLFRPILPLLSAVARKEYESGRSWKPAGAWGTW